ncbi:hypothetical protein C922_05169 [Plasmodium inui San Antonio 1]|uniref:Uncharacterized protein n=1 Tax=Plasmodium inui San Antonio 1 TaxID=1237626 RepID=W6ZYU0_9APIC|nr:hypothetical protein C922_05169 [Plasmodium inui San Antonio 1]EUD64455.1 hypothetical protein C922_05169 [Plasmodium inui San Antonio 1]
MVIDKGLNEGTLPGGLNLQPQQPSNKPRQENTRQPNEKEESKQQQERISDHAEPGEGGRTGGSNQTED